MGDPLPPARPPLTWPELALMLLVPAGMLAATEFEWWPIGTGDVLAFATGGVCVWLVVREHVATWPVGMLNNAILFVVCWRERLFADAWLQVVFFALAVVGWWGWVRRVPGRAELPVTRTRWFEWLAVALFVPAGVLGLREVLLAVQGAAPTPDASASVLSLAAQALMTRKRLEHWLLWIAVDCISVPLFVSRGRPLIAALFAVYLVMCLVGVVQWWRAYRAPRPARREPAGAGESKGVAA